jgi:hypothetical protein
MPVATITPDDTQRFNLKSVDGGFVELRHMTYGEWLHRRDMATKMALIGDPRGKDSKVSIDALQTETTLYEFSKVIVDHNLTDAEDRKLNLANKDDFTKLHPKIGEEISGYITDMNAWESDAEEVFPSSEQA